MSPKIDVARKANKLYLRTLILLIRLKGELNTVILLLFFLYNKMRYKNDN